MKTKFTILLFLIFITATYAQVNIGKSRSPFNLYVTGHKQKTFDKIKSIKTIFVVPNNLDGDKFKSIIKEVWTLNPIIFVEEESSNYDSINNNGLSKKYITSGNMVIRLIDDVYSKIKTGGLSNPKAQTIGAYIMFKFKASIFENVKEGKEGKLKFDEVTIAEIFFSPNIRLRQDIAYSAGGKKLDLGYLDKINEKYGEEPGFYTYKLGYIKNYFQEMNRRLSDSQSLKIYDGVKKKGKIQIMKNKTLYAPKWMLLKYNALAASYGKTRTEEKLFRKYGHKYKIISNEEINTKILNGDDFYYLNHTQFNQKKIVSVINGETGEIIYLNENGGSFNIKDSDLKSLGKLVD